MIKRILVALDLDEDTSVASRLAAEIAAPTQADVTGLAIVDTKRVRAETGGGGAIGGMYYAEKTRRRLTDDARTAAEKLVETFDTLLDETATPHRQAVTEGVPWKLIADELMFHDLLVIGRNPHFFYSRPGMETNTLSQVVKESAAACLVVGPGYRSIQRVLIGFDGSAPAARALQQFARLQPFGADVEVEIACIEGDRDDESRYTADALVQEAKAYLQAHGFGSVEGRVFEGDEPGDVLLREAEQRGSDLLVAGAHAVSALRRLAFGSTTDTLLQESTVPLFLVP